MTTKLNHAIDKAAGYAKILVELHNGYILLSGREADTVQADGVSFNDSEDILEHVREMPLSVLVRSGWYCPGAEDQKPEEYEILLSTGGPALRIVGDLTQSGEPTDPRLQWQDWGMAWADHDSGLEDIDEALQWFCKQFYFAE